MKKLFYPLLLLLLFSCGKKAPPLPIKESIPEELKISAKVQGKAIYLTFELPTHTKGGQYLTSLNKLIIEREEYPLDEPWRKPTKKTFNLKAKLHSAAPYLQYEDTKVFPRRLYVYRARPVKDFLVKGNYTEEIKVYFRYPPKAPINLTLTPFPNNYYLLRFEPLQEDLSGALLDLPLNFRIEKRQDERVEVIELKEEKEYLFQKELDQKVCLRVQSWFRYFATEIAGPFSREVCVF